MRTLLQIFRPDPYSEEIGDEKIVAKQYRYWRIRMFLSIYLGYVVYYFTRRSFVSVMPKVGEELGFANASLGIMLTVLAVSYGVSKFISGLMGDRSNARYFMAVGLILTGIINICFGFTSTLWMMAILWGLNGWFQGWGMPPSAKTMMFWFSKSERGTWWSIWSTAHCIGAMLIPLIAAAAAEHWGWRYGLFVPGVLAIVMGVALIFSMRDTPQSLGLPSIDVYRSDYEHGEKKGSQSDRQLTYREILLTHILPNKFIWMLAIAYAFVYIVRTGVSDWVPKYLMEKGHAFQTSAVATSFFEIAGILGMLMTGWCSDMFFRGRRAPLNILFSFLVIIPIVCIYLFNSTNIFVDYVFVFVCGFFIYGPQMLIGLNAAELAHKRAAASAVGFVGLFAYLGAALAGGPLGYVIDTYGWEGFFVVMIGSAVLATLLLVPTLFSQTNENGKDSPGHKGTKAA